MTVDELKKHLEDFPPDAVVLFPGSCEVAQVWAPVCALYLCERNGQQAVCVAD